MKIYNRYGARMYRILQENPYQMAEDLEGVGFKIADEIASKIGIHTDSDYRIRSGLFYVLTQASGEGHMFLPQHELLRRASVLLGVEPERMEKHVMDLAMDGKVVVKELFREKSRFRWYMRERTISWRSVQPAC